MKLSTIFIILFLLTGCWDSDAKHTSTDEVEIIDGHTLPPDPGEAGKETLLGIDSNNDGVRDDVERWIYKTYSSKIRREVLMQGARAHQAMLADPDAISNAQKWQQVITNRVIACESYLFRKYDIEYGIESYSEMKKRIYNSEERLEKYMRYDHALGGGVYGVEENERVKSSCDFNITKAMQQEK
ncbi:hypothetical protein WCX72_07055 [Sulfurimonas sp. HSL1-6]|uniref:hypothetical protein n=1 Tax=Thiomicrolovo immobilis TaxID=3131935 RepID=UPI0031F8155C